MDPLTWTFIICSCLGASSVVLCVCNYPCKMLDDSILHGEGFCNKYFGCCISKPSQFSDGFDKKPDRNIEIV